MVMNMNEQRDTRGFGFVAGLLTGACVGMGVAMWLAPRAAAEARARVAASARELGQQASEQLEQASAAIGVVGEEIVKRGRTVRDEVADAVVTGAGEVSRYATAAKSDPHSVRRAS